MIKDTEKRLIEGNPVALATTHSGDPNLIVVACVKVVAPNQILITDNYMSVTLLDLHENHNICLAVWDKDWNGLKVIGKAEYFDHGEWLRRVKTLKENDGLPAKGAIIVTVNQLIKLK